MSGRNVCIVFRLSVSVLENLNMYVKSNCFLQSLKGQFNFFSRAYSKTQQLNMLLEFIISPFNMRKIRKN